jgi:DNA topoisomerase I
LRLSARATMQAAQRLYENGLITYMRTDSTTLSDEAIAATRKLVAELYGDDYVPRQPRQYRTKVKNAQEAHEAIRPSGDFLRPEELRSRLGLDEARVYELIWKRTMASQMEDARGHRISVQVTGGDAVFQASGKTIAFPGFLRAYVEGADDPDAELADKEVVLPDVAVGDKPTLRSLEPRGHTTQPPARYTEASLVKKLEDSGVGRPSTYAMIIDTITRREYVVKQRNALVPTFMAFAVVGLLERWFTHLVDVNFTAEMESDLDAISRGEKEWLPYLQHFYFGAGQDVSGTSEAGLKRLLESDIDPRESCTLPLGSDSEGRRIDVRIGRYGPYLERGEERATIPEGLAPDELTVEKAVELLETGSAQRELGKGEDGRSVYLKAGRYGPYVQLGENGEEPRMKSLLPGMLPEEVTLEQALRLLTLPRTVGTDPATGEPVLADFGRYGPYIRRGSDTRSLESAEQVFDIDLDGALAVLATEKRGGFRGGSKPKVLRELGKNASGDAVHVLSGRYGPYVTDGATNASLPKGVDPDQFGLDAALELLAARAASGKGKKKVSRKKAAKKAASASGDGAAAPKRATKKSQAKKASVKKAAGAKAGAKKTGAGRAKRAAE